MKFHELKCWPREFRDVVRGRKLFEIRRDDREFKEDDIVILHEFIPDEPLVIREEHRSRTERDIHLPVKPGYTGESAGPFAIGYVLRSACLPHGWCGFQLLKFVRDPS